MHILLISQQELLPSVNSFFGFLDVCFSPTLRFPIKRGSDFSFLQSSDMLLVWSLVSVTLDFRNHYKKGTKTGHSFDSHCWTLRYCTLCFAASLRQSLQLWENCLGCDIQKASGKTMSRDRKMAPQRILSCVIKLYLRRINQILQTKAVIWTGICHCSLLHCTIPAISDWFSDHRVPKAQLLSSHKAHCVTLGRLHSAVRVKWGWVNHARYCEL